MGTNKKNNFDSKKDKKWSTSSPTFVNREQQSPESIKVDYAVTPKSLKDYWRNSYQETEKNNSSSSSKIVLLKTDQTLGHEDLLPKSKTSKEKTSLSEKDNSLNSSHIPNSPIKNIKAAYEKKRSSRVKDLKKKNKDSISKLTGPKEQILPARHFLITLGKNIGKKPEILYAPCNETNKVTLIKDMIEVGFFQSPRDPKAQTSSTQNKAEEIIQNKN